MKRGGPSHPKMGLLSAKLGLRRYEAVGVMESLYHFTAAYAKRGNIGKWTNREIASGIGWDRDPDELIGALLETGWFDSDPQWRLLVHDWPDHADQTVKRCEEVQKYGFATPTDSLKSQNASKQLANASKNYPGRDPCFTAVAEAVPKPKPEPEPAPLPKPVDGDGTGRGGAVDLDGGDNGCAVAGQVPEVALFWEGVRGRANQALRQLGMCAPSKPSDRSLLIKACALVALGKAPESWLAESVEAVKVNGAKSPWAYLHTCLKNRAKDSGKDLKALLASVKVPEHFLIPREASHART